MHSHAEKSLKSPANEDVDAQVSFVFDVGLQVGHFEVIVDPVHDEVWEPRVLPLGLE